jgi:anaerobic dimethyl sulfoxide reductase subunit B
MQRVEMQIGFYFDQTRCIGCHTCEVACKDWHDVPEGPARWVAITEVVEGVFPEPFVAYMFRPCYHCAEPACADACPVSAIEKRSADGIVVVDRQICLGEEACARCRDACPYGAIQFGNEKNATCQKCNLCVDRWLEGLRPVCVEACPSRALDAGPIEELKSRCGNLTEAAGFVHHPNAKPSVIFRKKTRERGQ